MAALRSLPWRCDVAGGSRRVACQSPVRNCRQSAAPGPRPDNEGVSNIFREKLARCQLERAAASDRNVRSQAAKSDAGAAAGRYSVSYGASPRTRNWQCSQYARPDPRELGHGLFIDRARNITCRGKRRGSSRPMPIKTSARFLKLSLTRRLDATQPESNIQNYFFGRLMFIPRVK